MESSFAWASHAEVSSSVRVVQSLTDWQSGSAAEEQPAQASSSAARVRMAQNATCARPVKIAAGPRSRLYPG